MNSKKEWNFNFGIYTNNDSLIEAEKCEKLMDSIVQWVEENNFSCGGGFDVYPQDEFCHCSNNPTMVIMSRYGENFLVCLSCNNYIVPEKIKIDVETTAKLQQWQRVYNSIDRLWLDSGDYEAWAISELSKPSSHIHQEGFEVQKMMQTYGKTYYWWFQNIGSTDKPLSTCPKCTKLLEKKADKLVCEKCLLLMQGEW